MGISHEVSPSWNELWTNPSPICGVSRRRFCVLGMSIQYFTCPDSRTWVESSVKPSWSSGPTESRSIRNVSAFTLSANAVPSGVPRRKPNPAPYVQAPGFRSAPSAAPRRPMSPAATASAAIHVPSVPLRFIAGSSRSDRVVSINRTSRFKPAPEPAHSLHHRADDPGRELLLAHPRELALRALTRGDRDHFLEDPAADRLERRALEDDAAVDVHVLFHVAVHERVGRELDGRHRLAAEDRAAPGREADDVAAAGDEPGDRDGIVARGVHEDEAARRDRLTVEEDVHHRRRPALGDAAQRLLEHGRDAARLVAGRRVVVHGLDAAAVPLPPLVAVDELLRDALVDRAPHQEWLGAVDLGRLAAKPRPAVPR